MDDSTEQTLMQYMRAALRANRPVDLQGLTFTELQGAFHMIPRNFPTLEDWLVKMGVNSKEEPIVPTEPTDNEKEELNESAISGFAQLAKENQLPEYFSVKVEPKKDE